MVIVVSLQSVTSFTLPDVSIVNLLLGNYFFNNSSTQVATEISLPYAVSVSEDCSLKRSLSVRMA
jgi:hypothetical protein